MKNYIKIYLMLLLAIPIISGISGCKKFLDRRPLGQANEDDITQSGLEGEVLGLYAALRNDGMSGFNILVLKTIRSDDSEKGSSPGDQADITPVFNNFDYNKDYWLVNGYWDDHFNLISLSNSVIHAVDSLQLTDPESLTFKAEAMCLRAYTYFDLVRDFGEVPKIDFKVYNPQDINKPKVSVDEIYALIDSDLQFASEHLPLTWDPEYVGRVTKGTANTLIAKTQLYRQNWTQALAKAEEVIGSGIYSLVTPYHRIWKEEGENSTESIFEIGMYANVSGNVVFGNNHNQVQGVRGSGEWDLGWGFNVPEQNLVDFYTNRNDPRINATVLFSGQFDGGPEGGGYGRVVPDAPPLLQKYWNKKVYYNPARREAMTSPTNDAQFGKWLNIKLIRYADVLLMAAEAANELNQPEKALEYLEMIRARARNGAPAGVLPEITTTDQGQLRQIIKDERRAEFGMEYERFYDLVRWGDADDVLGDYGYEERNRYYPIPQIAIDRSGGVLTQNGNY